MKKNEAVTLLLLGLLSIQPLKAQEGTDAFQQTATTFPNKGVRGTSSAASTSLPLKMSYQGLLTSTGGAPVADGAYDLTIGLYDSLSAGSVQWSEVHTGVPVQRGTFSVTLGESSPLNLQFNKPLFVQVSATGGPAGPSYPLTFSPRSALTSSPYSLAPWVTNGTNVYYKNGSVGLGSAAPDSSTIGTLRFEIADEDGGKSDMAMRVASFGYPVLNFAKSRGTLAAPAADVQGDLLGVSQFLGHDGTAFRQSAGIASFVDSLPGGNKIPAKLSFYTTNARNGWSEKMALDRNGHLSLDGGIMNDGALNPGLAFGGAGSGEGIASKRTSGGNLWGLDFYTAFNPRMSISNTGKVGIGTTSPSSRLDIRDSSGGNALYLRNSNAATAYGLWIDVINPASAASAYRYGAVSFTQNASAANFGGYFTGSGGTQAVGLFGNGNGSTGLNLGGQFYANGGATAYGVYGYAANATTNYAGYFAGNLAYTGSLINASDAKFKDDIRDYSGALERIMQVKARTYSFKTGKDLDRFSFAKGVHVGFVAQELEQVFPELVTTVVQPPEQDEKGRPKGDPVEYKGVKTLEMIPILLEAIQEQQKLINVLQAKVARLEDKK